MKEQKNFSLTVVSSNTVDPLFRLFEQYLVSRSYENSNEFTKELAARYLAYLDTTLAHVPFHTRQGLLEDLAAEVQEMLVKKMYGCMRVDDYRGSGKVARVTRSNNIVAVEGELRLSESDGSQETGSR